MSRADRLKQAQLIAKDSESWHLDYKDSAYIYAGGLPFELTEGDVVCIFSQYGEVLDVNLIRDKTTGASKGFAFLRYEDQRSTILAVDNLGGAKVLGRSLRVDHVSNYKQPKKDGESAEDWLQDPRASMNVAPQALLDTSDTTTTVKKEDDSREKDNRSAEDFTKGIDPEDPMFDYLVNQRREDAEAKKAKKASEHRERKASRHHANHGERRHRSRSPRSSRKSDVERTERSRKARRHDAI